jgi:hypothetical protein
MKGGGRCPKFSGDDEDGFVEVSFDEACPGQKQKCDRDMNSSDLNQGLYFLIKQPGALLLRDTPG